MTTFYVSFDKIIRLWTLFRLFIVSTESRIKFNVCEDVQNWLPKINTFYVLFLTVNRSNSSSYQRVPAPNLDRALAPSWVGRFYCLTQELVTRLNFGSASAQAAPSLLPLLTLLLTFCPGAAQGVQSRSTHM